MVCAAPEAAAPPRSRSGRCLFLAASHSLCSGGFWGQLDCAQGLFPVSRRRSGHLSAAPCSVIQTLARVPCPRSDQTTTHHRGQAARLLGGREPILRVVAGERPAERSPKPSTKQIKVLNLVLYLPQPQHRVPRGCSPEVTVALNRAQGVFFHHHPYQQSPFLSQKRALDPQSGAGAAPQNQPTGSPGLQGAGRAAQTWHLPREVAIEGK